MKDDSREIIDVKPILVKNRDVVCRTARALQSCLADHVDVVVGLAVMYDRTWYDIAQFVLRPVLDREETCMVSILS